MKELDVFTKALSLGYNISLSDETRRLTIDGDRDWYARYFWTITRGESVRKGGGCDGFITPEDCTYNLCEVLATLEVGVGHNDSVIENTNLMETLSLFNVEYSN